MVKQAGEDSAERSVLVTAVGHTDGTSGGKCPALHDELLSIHSVVIITVLCCFTLDKFNWRKNMKCITDARHIIIIPTTCSLISVPNGYCCLMVLRGYVVLTKLSRFIVLIWAFCTSSFLFYLHMLFWGLTVSCQCGNPHDLGRFPLRSLLDLKYHIYL